jgi:hypothetical protein
MVPNMNLPFNWEKKGRTLNWKRDHLEDSQVEISCSLKKLGYVLCTGKIHCDNSEWAYIVYWLDHPHRLAPLASSLPHLKQLQEVSLFYFV